MKFLLQNSFFFFLFWQVMCQDVTFPVNEENAQTSGISSNLKAKSVSSKSCPENMILQADENSTDAECDCQSGFLYHPEKDSCFEPYKQGPCPPEHYLVLPPKEITARCEKNPCLEDGLVSFQGKCHLLGQFGPPCEDSLSKLGFEESTFELKCSKPEEFGAIFSRVNAPTTPDKNCPKGTRRIFTGKCKRVFD